MTRRVCPPVMGRDYCPACWESVVTPVVTAPSAHGYECPCGGAWQPVTDVARDRAVYRAARMIAALVGIPRAIHWGDWAEAVRLSERE